MSSQRIIKKYKNRRLYDTTHNSYITLGDVKQLICDHVDFKVIDSTNDKDLTQITLLQIITEQETSSTPIFTNEMLRNFICSYQEKSQNIFRDYLEQNMQMIAQQNNFLFKQWKNYQSTVSPNKKENLQENSNDTKQNSNDSE